MGGEQWPGPRIGEDVPIESIQPGGGFCIGLERLWGYWRRFWLRRLRPGYVASMRAKRHGECEGCLHDIVDVRDLKLYQNVCGYYFRPEDDAFQWRAKIKLARTGLAEVVFASLLLMVSIAALSSVSISLANNTTWFAALPILILYYHAIRFFRDPQRPTPPGPNLLISPSDGVVTDLHEVEDADFPGGRAYRMSIYLSPWDVHLNRNPKDATVSAVRYFPGRFLNARHKNCATQNEQLWVDFVDGSERTIRVKQISGAMARRLVCWLKPGDKVVGGERYGMIKYGSRSDILIPIADDFSVNTKVGDRVYAGTTVLVEFKA
jgi:phosphatidylserine decarboxylase